MADKIRGEDVNQLARLLFNSAAGKQYWGLGLEIIAAIISITVSFVTLADDISIVLASVIALMVLIAYWMKLQGADEYDLAETMRRYSVLMEALGWTPAKVQLSQWQQMVGRKLREVAKARTRDPNYYQSQSNLGPKRLAEMTLESAFYTRNLYARVKTWLWWGLVVTILLFFAAIILASIQAIPDTMDILIARVVIGLVPLILAIDLFGWARRLENLASNITEVERSIDVILEHEDPELARVMQVVSEYNCQVVQGFPIPNWLFLRWRDEIADLWKYR